MEPTMTNRHGRRSSGELIFLDRHPRARFVGNSPSATIRVLLADGEGLVRAGFRALLEGETDITVAGEAASGQEAVALATHLRPDVVVMDLRLPGLDGLEATRRILADPALSDVKVVIVDARERNENVLDSLRAGARGFLAKDSKPVDLLRTLRVVAGGAAQLSPCITRRLITEFASEPDPQRPAPEQLEELTAREREVMTLVAMGLTNGEIGERLVVSPATAKAHVSRAMVKLHARDRAKLVALAYETGLVQPRRLAVARPGAPLSEPTLAAA